MSRLRLLLGGAILAALGGDAAIAGDVGAKSAAAAKPAEVAKRVDALLASELQAPPAAVREIKKAWRDEKTGAIDFIDDSSTTGAANAGANYSAAAVAFTPPTLAAKADDETFLRRVTLDLIGEQPSPEQITAFALDPSRTKRSDVVNRLLADKHYGQNWGRYWRDVILARRSEERVLLMSATLVKYLTDSLNADKPWDEIAASFITANGEVLEEGATALIMAQAASPEDTTAEISRIFLGIQIQCAQCHNHPTDHWKREQFHELAAFFSRITLRRDNDGDKRLYRVAGNDRGIGRRAPGSTENVSLEHYMPDLQDPQAKGTLMTPVFFATGQRLPLGVSDQERRETLAKWLTAPSNPSFAEGFVNRMWSELIGHGFAEPVDDMGPDRTPRAPQTLKLLASQFAANHYDVKWLLRTIIATDAYQRESRSRGAAGEPLAASCPQRLRADQLFNSLTYALGLDEAALLRRASDATPSKGKKAAGAADTPAAEKPLKAKQSDITINKVSTANLIAQLDPNISMAADEMKAVETKKADAKSEEAKAAAKAQRRYGVGDGPRAQVAITFGYDPSERRDEVAGTIPQALWLMNGLMVNRSTQAIPETSLGQLLARESSDEAVVIELYMRSLAREPKPGELRTCLEHVQSAGRQAGFEDVLWSLVNSTEFLYRK